MLYRREGRARLLLLVFLVLAIVIITLDFRQGSSAPLQRVKDLAEAVVAPVQRGFTVVTKPVGGFFSSIAELPNIRSEKAALESRVEQLESQASQVGPLETENSELRRLLRLQKRWTSMRAVTAQVIGPAPTNFKWALTLDKGRRDGIRSDMAVISLDGLVGKVIQATPSTAAVLLLIDPGAAAGARVEGVRDTGIARGNGADEDLSLDLVSTSAQVGVGDSVVTSGYNSGIFPPGIPIGVVAEVSQQTAAVQSEISVQPAVDFSALDYVSVLLDTGREISRRSREER